MKSFHTTQNLSLIILGLGMIVSAHATVISCDREFKTDGEIVEVENSIVCDTTDAPNGYAVLISGKNIKFFLQDNSITAGSPAPARGISITNDSNHVIGLGTVAGFGDFAEPINGNIVIDNADDNHVNKLNLSGGINGVFIFSDVDGEQAKGNDISHNLINDTAPGNGIEVRASGGGSVAANHIHHNSVNNTTEDGIRVRSTDTDSSAHANHIYHNSIQMANDGILVSSLQASSTDGNNVYDNYIEEVTRGIQLVSSGGGSTDGNHIYDNSIKKIDNVGVLVFSDDGSADGNQVDDNNIQDTGDVGIELDTRNGGTANQNIVILNHIIRPGTQAIALAPFPLSTTVADNMISLNITKQPQASPVYCDSSGQSNQWPVNAIGLQLVFGFPGPC